VGIVVLLVGSRSRYRTLPFDFRPACYPSKGEKRMAFRYFGYGSNMSLASLRAKGVVPRASQRAELRGWRLRFNVRHFFAHEGGVGNIENTGEAAHVVQGVLHCCEDEHLALLDVAEAHGHGYHRVQVPLHTAQGEQSAVAYVGAASFIDEQCRPTRRYLGILLQGAAAAGLDAGYIEALRRQPLHVQHAVPPFVPPPGEHRVFTAATLTAEPPLTALDGHVFDMSGARWQHAFLKGLFGGKDMTLFHLQRMHGSDGLETLADVRQGRLTPAQRLCLDEYLHAYAAEYVYAGRYSGGGHIGLRCDLR
jgi:sulfite reductase (NADPH) flavoprotein alpha-component